MRILQWSAVPTSESQTHPPSDGREVQPSGIIWVALGATLWGSDTAFRRPLTGTLSSAEIVFFEHVILAVILLPIAIRARRRGGLVHQSPMGGAFVDRLGRVGVGDDLFYTSHQVG